MNYLLRLFVTSDYVEELLITVWIQKRRTSSSKSWSDSSGIKLPWVLAVIYLCSKTIFFVLSWLEKQKFCMHVKIIVNKWRMLWIKVVMIVIVTVIFLILNNTSTIIFLILNKTLIVSCWNEPSALYNRCLWSLASINFPFLCTVTVHLSFSKCMYESF